MTQAALVPEAIDVAPLTRLFKSLADDTRVRIVALLSHGELCVCHIEAALGLTQPTTSRHLAVLRNAGVVTRVRRGAWVYYSLDEQQDAACKSHLSALIDNFTKRQALRRDVKRLIAARRPGSCGPGGR